MQEKTEKNRCGQTELKNYDMIGSIDEFVAVAPHNKQDKLLLHVCDSVLHGSLFQDSRILKHPDRPTPMICGSVVKAFQVVFELWLCRF